MERIIYCGWREALQARRKFKAQHQNLIKQMATSRLAGILSRVAFSAVKTCILNKETEEWLSSTQFFLLLLFHFCVEPCVCSSIRESEH